MKITLLNISHFDDDFKIITDFEIWYDEADAEKIIQAKGSKSSSSNASTNTSNTRTTTNAQSGAFEDISTEDGLQVGVIGGGTVNIDQPLTAQTIAATGEYLTSAQTFLGETFATALNFVNDTGTKALEVASGRDLDTNATVDNQDEQDNKLLIGVGIITAGVVAYKVMK